MKRLGLILVFTLITSPAWATISLLQKKACEVTSGGTSQTCAFTSANTNPSEIVVIQRWGSATQPTIAASDTASNTYACQQINDTTNGRWAGVCKAANTSTSTITVTCSNGGTTDTSAIGCDIAEYSGLSNTIDNALTGVCSTAATTSPSSGSVTNGNANDLFVGFFTVSTSNTTVTCPTGCTESSGFTTEDNDTFGTTTHDHLQWADDIVSTIASRAYNPTINASVTVCIGITSIQATGGGGGATPTASKRDKLRKFGVL